jgi:uncharacterized membrane protein YfcA
MAHQRHGAVEWPIFWRITPGIALGALAGSALADLLAARTLKILFVMFMFVIAAQMARGTVATRPHARLPGALGTSAVGTVIGLASALFGIGGGTLSVPFMTWCSVPVKRAIATSAAIGLAIALSGAIGYVVAGLDEPGLPPWSVGYVVLPAWAGIVVASMLAAPLGARLAHRLSDTMLRRIFALFVALLGLHMLWRLITV